MPSSSVNGLCVPVDKGRRPSQATNLCAVDGCDKQSQGGRCQNMCKAHFSEANPDAPNPMRAKQCRYEGCTKFAQGGHRGMCRAHYTLTNSGAPPKARRSNASQQPSEAIRRKRSRGDSRPLEEPSSSSGFRAMTDTDEVKSVQREVTAVAGADVDAVTVKKKRREDAAVDPTAEAFAQIRALTAELEESSSRIKTLRAELSASREEISALRADRKDAGANAARLAKVADEQSRNAGGIAGQLEWVLSDARAQPARDPALTIAMAVKALYGHRDALNAELKRWATETIFPSSRPEGLPSHQQQPSKAEGVSQRQRGDSVDDGNEREEPSAECAADTVGKLENLQPRHHLVPHLSLLENIVAEVRLLAMDSSQRCFSSARVADGTAKGPSGVYTYEVTETNGASKVMEVFETKGEDRNATEEKDDVVVVLGGEKEAV